MAEATPPTVLDMLGFPEIRRGHPVVLAGRDELRREVTWVHVLESGNVAGTLEGGELVLCTGVALPDSNDGLRRWVEDLCAAGASGLLVQLGERWVKLPAALVRAAECARLPLIGLQTGVSFVEIARAALGSIVQSSYAEMRQVNRVHELLHRLAVEGRSDSELVMTVSWLTHSAVVLESPHRHVLAFQNGPDGDTESVLGDWERRSRRNGAGETWVIGEVRARGREWGRLIALLDSGATPNQVQRVAVERGAENLALRRLTDGDGAACEFEARSELLAALVSGRYRYESEGRLRAEAAGFPTIGRELVGLAVHVPGVAAGEVRRATAEVAAAARLDLLLGEDNVGLLSVPRGRDPGDAARVLADRLHPRVGAAVIGLGEPVSSLSGVTDSLRDATSAARARLGGTTGRSVVRLADVRVRGLLAQLDADPRLQSYVERELGPLLDADRAGELAALRAYLAGGRNKSAAAGALQLSRPAFYARLDRAAGLLGADLADAETCLSLQLALLAHDVIGAVAPAAVAAAAVSAPVVPMVPRGSGIGRAHPLLFDDGAVAAQPKPAREA